MAQLEIGQLPVECATPVPGTVEHLDAARPHVLEFTAFPKAFLRSVSFFRQVGVACQFACAKVVA